MEHDVLLSPNRVALNLSATGIQQVLNCLVEKGHLCGLISDPERVLADLRDRETVRPFCSLATFSIPRVASSGATAMGLCVAVLQTPIVCDCAACHLVNLVVLFVGPAPRNDLWMKELRRIANAMYTSDNRQKLIEAPTEELLCAQFTKLLGRL
jgi:mannitol/fructose-specific phosphotransferase system IIA component (Ntr-type)